LWYLYDDVTFNTGYFKGSQLSEQSVTFMNLLRYDFRSCSYVDTGSQMPQPHGFSHGFTPHPMPELIFVTGGGHRQKRMGYSESTVTVRCCVCWRQRTLTVDGHILETVVQSSQYWDDGLTVSGLPSGHLLWTDTYHGGQLL